MYFLSSALFQENDEILTLDFLVDLICLFVMILTGGGVSYWDLSSVYGAVMLEEISIEQFIFLPFYLFLRFDYRSKSNNLPINTSHLLFPIQKIDILHEDSLLTAFQSFFCYAQSYSMPLEIYQQPLIACFNAKEAQVNEAAYSPCLKQTFQQLLNEKAQIRQVFEKVQVNHQYRGFSLMWTIYQRNIKCSRLTPYVCPPSLFLKSFQSQSLTMIQPQLSKVYSFIFIVKKKVYQSSQPFQYK